MGSIITTEEVVEEEEEEVDQFVVITPAQKEAPKPNEDPPEILESKKLPEIPDSVSPEIPDELPGIPNSPKNKEAKPLKEPPTEKETSLIKPTAPINKSGTHTKSILMLVVISGVCILLLKQRS